MTEARVNALLRAQWLADGGIGAPRTVREWWMEACRQADDRGVPEPCLSETIEHFAWFFGEAA